MALKIKRKTRIPDEVPLSSTSDIAFLLIIFFLTASALLEFHGVQLPLPKPDAPPMEVLKKNIFRVKVAEDGTYLYEKRPIKLPELQKVVHDSYQKNRDLVVILEVNEQSPVYVVPAFIHMLNEEKIVRFSLGMERSP